MMRRIMLNIGMASLLILAPLVSSGSGLLFKIIANGESSGNINMTLCLNGNGPLSCQNYTVNNLNLNITTTISNKTYFNAGIKINTPGYTLANTQCRANAKGFCLFSVNDQTSTNLLLTPLVPPAPPGAPTNVTATAAGDFSAEVNWTPPVDSIPVANYIITPNSLSTTPSPTATVCPNTADFCTVHNLTNGLPYTFSVQAQNSGGESAASSASNQVNPPAWTYSFTATQNITPPGTFSSISCTSSDFCMAIGNDASSTSFACSYIDQSWNCSTVSSISVFQSVSCVNQNFCMALDLYGQAIEYNSSSQTPWGNATTLTSNYLNSVSCPSTDFCMAVDNQGYAYKYNGTNWGTGGVLVTATAGIALNAVSCPSSTSCTAVDVNGKAYSYIEGSGWGSAQTPTNQPLSSVSCPMNSPDAFCMAGGIDNSTNYANAYIYRQTTPPSPWTSTSLSSQEITYSGLSSVSCASDNFCMGVIGGSVYNYISGNTPTWDTGNYLAYTTNLNAVSCPSAQFCMAVDINGNAYIYTPSS